MAAVTVTGSDERWEAHAEGQLLGSRLVGTLRAVVRPDRRCFLVFRDCHPDAYGPLLARAVAELDHDLYATADEARLPQLLRLGFTVWRRERYYLVSTDRVRVPDVGTLPGVELISAVEADLDRLQVLDETLRQEIPGCDGWHWSPEEFREETLSTGFDPATYLVAVQRRTGDYLGLVRVWMKPERPRLGCIGVLPPFRRTRLTAALLGAVFQVLRERGHTEVVTDIDSTNRPALALAARCGAIHTGDFCEVVLPRAT